MNEAVAIFDSGIGGLSVLRQLAETLPHENILYFADQAHVPYGPRPAQEIRHFCQAIGQFLIDQGAKIIVLACNTASAAALTHLRQLWPATPVVGMEPAVKPAAQQTKSGKVGVLATAVTFDSPRYADLLNRFGQNITVYEDACPGLVELIEAGEIHSPQTGQLLRPILAPMLNAGIDTLVLGCTHYPFVLSLLAEIAGKQVTIIDPAPAVARQTARVLWQHDLLAAPTPSRQVHLLTTGDKAALQHFAAQVLPVSFTVGTAVWQKQAAALPVVTFGQDIATR
jgi:glutamate racemase